MKAVKSLVLLVMLGLAAASGAWAHGPRVGVGVYVGPGPYWDPFWYPPYYYPPRVVVVPAPTPAPPPVYIEQQAPAATQSEQQYWYYCASAKAYYPYVKECPGGWQRVLPQPEK